MTSHRLKKKILFLSKKNLHVYDCNDIVEKTNFIFKILNYSKLKEIIIIIIITR